MEIKTRGIVLHSTKFSETSVIVRIYTEKLGLQSYIVKGVRTAKSKPKAAMLQPLTLLEMDVLHRENKSLQFIKEFRRDVIYQSLPFDTLKTAIAIFLLEVISKSVREHEPNAEMFEFIYDSLCRLDTTSKLNPDYHLLFLIHFSAHLGFFPHQNFSETNCFFELNEGEFIAEQKHGAVVNLQGSRLLHRLLQSELTAPVALIPSKAERKMLLQYLLKYYQLHVENFSLKSPEVLESVLG